MNELVYLTEEDFKNIATCLHSVSHMITDTKMRDSMWNTLERVTFAHNKGLFLSFDVKKAKVRRVR